MSSTLAIDVIIADDSAYLRKNISDILKEHDLINIIDFARDGKEAVQLVKKHSPDVLVLDLVMPKMNGLDAFKLIMDEHPTPTVILSAISPKNLDSSIQALLMGAFDYIIKPGGIGAKDLPRFREELLAKVLLASQSQIKRIFNKGENQLLKGRTIRQEIVNKIFDFGKYLNRLTPVKEAEAQPEFDRLQVKAILQEEIKTVDKKAETITNKTKRSFNASEAYQKRESKPSVNRPKNKIISSIQSVEKKPTLTPDLSPIRGLHLTTNLIVIGASVGGPRTITTILKDIPKTFHAPILVVQHLSSHFTDAFSDSLNTECDLNVKVATHGDTLKLGTVYIAPGEKHMEIAVENGNPMIKIYKGNPVNFCMPSIDVLFFSAAKVYRNRTLGVLLTGMGSDGVEGLGTIRKLGGKTIAESEETCILYAMPKFAIEKGYADFILTNHDISQKLIELSRK
ncbi:MAG: chemotaxis-specific protein-glutamate methyltransferase CheB [Promethearchaeota archaeon]|jgi:two-component system chemotaxis response regulator CheB